MAAVSANDQINSKESCKASGPSKKKRRRCKASVDRNRISNLPSDIADRILECLPIKDAVRTSILSKHWRYKWAYLPQLILDVPFFDSLLELHSFPCNIPDGMFGYSEVVNNILLRHVGPIHKFSLELPRWFSEDVDISPWIQFLSAKFVKELALSAELHVVKNPPSCLFSSVGFNHLTHLTFENWDFLSLPTMIGGFPFLVSLQLSNGYLGNATGEVDKLGILISRCPLLKTLRLDIYATESSLRIHAPRLQNMIISGELSSICLEETKEIKTLSLHASWEQKMDVMIEFFTCLPHVEKIDLSYNFWSSECFTEVGPPKMLKPSTVLRQLKHLVLIGAMQSYQFLISFIVFLFQLAPQLQTFKIDVWSFSKPFPEDIIVEEDCCLCDLKFVKLEGDMDTAKFMLQLVKLILSSAPVLEIMSIEAGPFLAEEKLIITKDLLRCQRASANAKIILNI